MLSSQQKVAACIQDLEYDFDHFVLRDFVYHIAKRRGTPISVQRIPLDPDLFGVWIPGEHADYIFINNTLHPVQQIHCILHEIAHLLLDHPRQPLAQVLPPELIQLLNLETSEEGLARTLLRENTTEEQEAEAFVFQIQDKVIQANRLHELTTDGSSIEPLGPLTDTSAS